MCGSSEWEPVGRRSLAHLADEFMHSLKRGRD